LKVGNLIPVTRQLVLYLEPNISTEQFEVFVTKCIKFMNFEI